MFQFFLLLQELLNVLISLRQVLIDLFQFALGVLGHFGLQCFVASIARLGFLTRTLRFHTAQPRLFIRRRLRFQENRNLATAGLDLLVQVSLARLRSLIERIDLLFRFAHGGHRLLEARIALVQQRPQLFGLEVPLEQFFVLAEVAFDPPPPFVAPGRRLPLVEVPTQHVPGQGVECRRRDLGRVLLRHGSQARDDGGFLGRAELVGVEGPSASSIGGRGNADAREVGIVRIEIQDPAGIPQIPTRVG